MRFDFSAGNTPQNERCKKGNDQVIIIACNESLDDVILMNYQRVADEI